MLLRQEGGEEGHAVECCPSVLDMIEPEGGKNLDDIYVELYSDGENRQRFYERSCREDVVNKPCRFLDKKLYNQSRCVQKYSYTYALVRDATHMSGHAVARSRHHHDRGNFISKDWKMDYIRVRSGCSCEVLPKLKKKRSSKNKKNHRSRKFQFEFDTDET
ncbi:hypothetical protein RUM44_006038 [Polyplax serrata]|uniref:Spaetzle domain-containing protein n=1 Tax=Polyplax serrata TaxID=468196 RepID=A0ABR1B0N7_POLSC